MIDKHRCRSLLKKYLDGNINEGELNELFRLSSDSGIEALIAEMIEDDYHSNQITGADIPAAVSEQILEKILASEKHTNRLFIKSKRNNLYRKLAVAAVFLLTVTSIAFFYFRPEKNNSLVTFETIIPGNSITKTNTSLKTEVLVLEDGSTIRMAPNTSLSYPLHFVKRKREVYLTGEAFFEITKNPDAPFFVYYNNIITRVLGTSFNIKTNPATNNFEVSVRSGKVQVSENKYLTSVNLSQQIMKSVIVVPNQKALYNKTHRNFETTLADSIYPILKETITKEDDKNATGTDSFFSYKASSLKHVFSQLEKVYGLEIIVDNENIYNCVFTGDISKQDIWKKLNIICLTIGSTYEVKGTKVLVSGNGCN